VPTGTFVNVRDRPPRSPAASGLRAASDRPTRRQDRGRQRHREMRGACSAGYASATHSGNSAAGHLSGVPRRAPQLMARVGHRGCRVRPHGDRNHRRPLPGAPAVTRKRLTAAVLRPGRSSGRGDVLDGGDGAAVIGGFQVRTQGQDARVPCSAAGRVADRDVVDAVDGDHAGLVCRTPVGRSGGTAGCQSKPVARSIRSARGSGVPRRRSASAAAAWNCSNPPGVCRVRNRAAWPGDKAVSIVERHPELPAPAWLNSPIEPTSTLTVFHFVPRIHGEPGSAKKTPSPSADRRTGTSGSHTSHAR